MDVDMESVDDDEESMATTRSKASTFRPPDESREDRRVRKKTVKIVSQ